MQLFVYYWERKLRLNKSTMNKKIFLQKEREREREERTDKHFFELRHVVRDVGFDVARARAALKEKRGGGGGVRRRFRICSRPPPSPS